MSGPARVVSASEPWAEYRLEDGTLLRFRFTACDFRKTGKLTTKGDPEYTFAHGLLCEVSVPAEVVQLRALPDTAPSEYAAPAKDCA